MNAVFQSEQIEKKMNDKEQLFFVERVVNKRIRQNRTEYRVKWVGYNSRHNSWEPEENLKGCKEFIDDYESRVQQAELRRSPKNLKKMSQEIPRNYSAMRKNNNNTTAKKQKKERTGTRFDKGWEVEKILGIKPHYCGYRRHSFLVKWKNSNKYEFITSELLRKVIPNMIISFYEKHIKWDNS